VPVARPLRRSGVIGLNVRSAGTGAIPRAIGGDGGVTAAAGGGTAAGAPPSSATAGIGATPSATLGCGTSICCAGSGCVLGTTVTGGSAAGGAGSTTGVDVAMVSRAASMMFETLVDTTVFACESGPSSPGLRMRTDTETLQLEQVMAPVQSQFQVQVIPGTYGIDIGLVGVCPADVCSLFDGELVSPVFGT
jgi:hypothetical protein